MPEDEVRNVAKLFVEIGNVNMMTIQIGLHFGYPKSYAIFQELARLEIISADAHGGYNILAKLDQIDDIFDNDSKYMNAQQSLL